MGFGIVIAGSIMMIALITSFATMINSLNNTLRINETINDKIRLRDNISNTDIRISSIQASNNDDLVVITLTNNGTTKLWNYKYFDLIITYDANITNNKVRITESLLYSTVLSNGRWIIDSIINDTVDPGILNANEEALIHAKLSNIIYPNSKLIVSISTNYGVTYTTGKVL